MTLPKSLQWFIWRSFTRFLFTFYKIDLLIFPISPLHGFIKRQGWADLKLSLWSFSVMLAEALAIYSILSSSLALAAISLPSNFIDFPNGLVIFSRIQWHFHVITFYNPVEVIYRYYLSCQQRHKHRMMILYLKCPFSVFFGNCLKKSEILLDWCYLVRLFQSFAVLCTAMGSFLS